MANKINEALWIKVWNWLNGKKLYIGTAIAFAGFGFTGIGIPQIGDALIKIGSAIGVVGFVHKLGKIENAL